jgi:hypothetical protein
MTGPVQVACHLMNQDGHDPWLLQGRCQLDGGAGRGAARAKAKLLRGVCVTGSLPVIAAPAKRALARLLE